MQKALDLQPRHKEGLILHRDQGSQYTSKAFVEFCKAVHVTQSMSKADEIQGKIDLLTNKMTEAEKEAAKEAQEQSTVSRNNEFWKEEAMDYQEYIQKQLRDIRDKEERKEARELLLEGFLSFYQWAEGKYEALKERVEKEITLPWKAFAIHTTIVKREEADPINGFWHPLCHEDLKKDWGGGRKTIYLEVDDEGLKAFLQQKQLLGIEEKTGRTIPFRIEQARRYKECIQKLYQLFLENHVPWRSIPMGHLERFFDLSPEEEISFEENVHISYGKWESVVKEGMISLWNVEEIQMESQEFRLPCKDEVIYEHSYPLGRKGGEEGGILVDAKEEILSVRYEENQVFVKTYKEQIEEVKLYLLHQKEKNSSYGYYAPVLSNRQQDSLAARYLEKTGQFIQTPAELYRKVRALSLPFSVELLKYEIVEEGIEEALRGDGNGCLENLLFPKDKRKILLFTFRWKKEEEGLPKYLRESWLRYVLSQLQLEYLEYQCMGKSEECEK